MPLLALVAAASLSQLNPAAHSGWLLAQAPVPSAAQPSSAAADREVTIKALREEVTELEERKSGIGFVFPSVCIVAGVLGIIGGTQLQTSVEWLPTTLLIAGTVITSLSTLWLIVRIVRAVSLSGQISDKEEQLRRLEAQRVQVSLVPLAGGLFAGLSFAL